MRILLTAAMMVMAATAWADEPSAPAAQAEAKAESAADKVAEAKPAEQTAAVAQPADDKERVFKPPQGYRPKRINGEQVYCTKIQVLGSRFPKEDCRTEAQLRDLEAQKHSMRGEIDKIKHVCGSAPGCANP